MEEPKWKSFARRAHSSALFVPIAGPIFGSAYCWVYLKLWGLSFNQWYLPAGLRITGLLLIPYRYWPFLILGDAAALLFIRMPKLGKYSELWVYGTPFFIIMVVAIFLRFLRKHRTDASTIAHWLPVDAMVIALWTSAWLMVMNYFLGGPKHLVTPHNFVSYSVGDYLGIMMAALPALVFILAWKKKLILSMRLLRDTMFSVGAVVVLYVIATRMVDDEGVSIFFLLLMGLPATYLTVKHGWVGAAIGIFMVNLAIARTLPDVKLPGQFDANVFVAQQVLCVLAAILLTLGGRITEHYDRARRSGLKEADAKRIARRSYRFNENRARDQRNRLQNSQQQIDENRDHAAERLKKGRHFDEALAVKGDAVVQRKIFELHAAAISPQQIDEGGLLAVLHSDDFKDYWIGDAILNISFKGQPNELSRDSQLNAFRCICLAIAVLSECAPCEYTIYSRVWRKGKNAAIFLKICVTPTDSWPTSSESNEDWLELCDRALTHGGIVKRRHACVISLWLPEVPEPNFSDY